MAFVQQDLIVSPVTGSAGGAGPEVTGFGDTRGFAAHILVNDEVGQFRLTLQDSVDGVNWSNVASVDAFIGLNVIRTVQPTADSLRLAYASVSGSGTISIASAVVAAS